MTTFDKPSEFESPAMTELRERMTDTPPSAEQIIAECRACRPLDSLSSVAREGQLGLAALDIKALSDAGYMIFPTKTANSLADFALEFAKDKRLQKTAYEVSGKIIVDKTLYSDQLEALKAADKALAVMWNSYDRGDHGGSPGEWIYETMDQVSTALSRAMTQPKDTDYE